MLAIRHKIGLMGEALGIRNRLWTPKLLLNRLSDDQLYNIIGRVPEHRADKQYIVFNGAIPTTAAQVKMAVTTSINTLLQVLTPSTTGITIFEWGISFDNSVAGVPINTEFFANDVAITGATAVTPTIFGHESVASLCVGGTAATCFNDGAVTEGTVANARMFDCQLIPPTGSYWKQWPLGREPYMPPSKALRIRTTAPAAANAICYVCWGE